MHGFMHDHEWKCMNVENAMNQLTTPKAEKPFNLI